MKLKLLIAVLWGVTHVLYAGNILSIGKCSEKPEIDGKISEKCWDNTFPVTGFTLPGTLKYAPYQSEIRMCRDDKYLYGAIFCKSRSGTLNNKQIPQKDEPAIWKNDAMELFFIGRNEAGR